MRRLLTFVIVAIATAIGSLNWMHKGDLSAAIKPVVAEWNAELLARNAGIQAQSEVADED